MFSSCCSILLWCMSWRSGPSWTGPPVCRGWPVYSVSASRLSPSWWIPLHTCRWWESPSPDLNNGTIRVKSRGKNRIYIKENAMSICWSSRIKMIFSPLHSSLQEQIHYTDIHFTHRATIQHLSLYLMMYPTHLATHEFHWGDVNNTPAFNMLFTANTSLDLLIMGIF